MVEMEFEIDALQLFRADETPLDDFGGFDGICIFSCNLFSCQVSCSLSCIVSQD